MKRLKEWLTRITNSYNDEMGTAIQYHYNCVIGLTSNGIYQC